MSKNITKTPEKKYIADMTVGEFERVHKTEFREENKDMKLPKYFEKIGFPDFAKLIAD